MRICLKSVTAAVICSSASVTLAFNSYSYTRSTPTFHRSQAGISNNHRHPLQITLLPPSFDEAVATTPKTDNVSKIQDGLNDNDTSSDSFSYVQFAQTYPFVNNLMIATAKTAAADLLAQTVISQTPLMEIDVQRSLLFCLFGCVYLGAFQYAYQVQIFKRLFDVDKFTQQSWEEKIKDGPGLQALAAQTVLDLTVLTLIYLPTFYVFKSAVFSGSSDVSLWWSSGIENYSTNFAKDEFDLIRVWLPADLVCFSVPLYLRLPVRHIVSFVWTAYLSFARGGH